MTLKNAAILLFSFWFLAFVGTHLPGSSFSQVQLPIPGLDKCVHFGMFFVLSGLIANFLARRIENALPITLLTFSLATGYAAFDELTQMLIPSRSCDLNDFLADLIGVSTGLLTFHIARQIKRSWFTRKMESV